jgi:predicted nuclease of predicted toxin-antitoxin system
MKLRDFGLLTDESLEVDVVRWLRQSAFDVYDVCEQGLQGSADRHLLQLAVATNRVVVTHDADFGTLAILQGEPVIGVVYLRPGHIDAQFTIDTMQAVLNMDPDLSPPFILVARRSTSGIAIRIRQIIR